MLGKKAQGIGQVFMFIVAGITFAFVMIFGYNAISDFLEQGETVEFFQFKSDLENSVERIHSEYGAVRQSEFLLPSKYEEICFVDLDADFDPNNELCSKNPIACDVWETASQEGGYAAADENVFLTPPGPVVLKVFNLEIEDGFLCEDIFSGSFALRLEGKGSRTAVSEVS
ncbi:hypothetical protein HOC01_02540 [archaeon]|jgi:hypothetical protein|nr:hypothetical protein [archaeon]MBT6697803.1 hypothetical protein [archaeon]